MMMNLFSCTLFAALLSSQAYAQSYTHLETCELSGSLRLTRDTVITCSGTLHAQPGSEIVTQGYNLRLDIRDTLELFDPLKIRATDETSLGLGVRNSADVTVTARTCIGKLDIDNRPLASTDLGGDVTIECLTSLDYEPTVEVSDTATATFIRNGAPQSLISAHFNSDH